MATKEEASPIEEAHNEEPEEKTVKEEPELGEHLKGVPESVLVSKYCMVVSCVCPLLMVFSAEIY